MSTQTTITPAQLSDMIFTALECPKCSIHELCAIHYEAIIVVCGGAVIEPPAIEPSDRAVEVLAQHLYNDGVVHRTPPRPWENLEHSAKRQWRETARRYLTIASRGEQG